MRAIAINHAVENTLGDLRSALRQLRRAPLLAVLTILTLGLGIGATTAIFSLVNALLLEDLPFRDADRLIFVGHDLTGGNLGRVPLAAAELHDLRERTTSFSGIGGIWSNTTMLTGENPEELRIAFVTTDFFDVLGATAAYGRTFNSADEGAAPTILLSHALWQRRFGGDTSIVGTTIPVSDGQATVVGVMPPGFRPMMPPDSQIPDDLQAWLPMESSWFSEAPRGQRFWRVVARMRPDVTLVEAQAEIARVGTEIGREFTFYGERGLRLTSVRLNAEAVKDVKPTVLMLFGGVALLLIIACVNVASLFVARAATRQHETAVRLALGAGPGRVLRLHAAEGFVLAVLGGLAGVWIAQACLKLLLALRPYTLSRLDAASIDGTVLAFAAGVTLTWGLLLSLAPTTELWRTNVSGVLNGVGRAAGSRLPYRRRAALVVCQLALSVVLLVSAALLVRGFERLVNSDPGFSAENVVTFRLPAPNQEVIASFGGPDGFLQELRAQLGALPGVTNVGAISHLPYDEGLPNWATPYLREGDTDADNAALADTRAVLPGYFEAVGARLVEGRFFSDADVPEAPTVAIVDDRLAQRMWPGESAIGQRFVGDPRTSGAAAVTATVVGVVRHLRHRRPTQEVREQIYYPVRQAPRNPMAFVVRGTVPPDVLAPQVRQTMTELDRRLAMSEVRPFAEYVESARAARRFAMVLAAAFAVAALLLTALGAYGVTAYGVAVRRRELGVRQALGASPRAVARLVTGEVARLLAAGLVLGLAGAASAAFSFRAQLYGVSAADPIAYGAALLTVSIAVALAGWLPVRRATRVNPAEALRAE
jgi:putative ABC transport system permease protein